MSKRFSENASTAADMKRRSALFLVGFMGAGKTSVGQELARQLSWEFIDLDERIVARTGRTIADIFQTDGEAVFRSLETRTLAEVISEVRQGISAVIALGGGAYVEQANEHAIREAGFPVVFLDGELEELRRRCAEASGTRPLFQDEDRFRSLYESRREHYRRADIQIDTTSKTVEAVAKEILELPGIAK